jgi:hypothetical protein
MALYGADWRDPKRYALVLNLGQMILDAAKQAIVEMARLKKYQPTPDFREALQNLTLTLRSQTTLVMSSNSQKLPVDVRAKQGVVTVAGNTKVLSVLKPIPVRNGQELSLPI